MGSVTEPRWSCGECGGAEMELRGLRAKLRAKEGLTKQNCLPLSDFCPREGRQLTP